MILHTTSEVISLAKQLENESASYYRALADAYGKNKAELLPFIEGNAKHIVQIERAYYGVISDAIEGCFAFNIESDDYILKAGLEGNTTYDDGMGRAIEMEEKLIRFYADAAEQSKHLMADVPREFTLVANKRKERLSQLRALLQKVKGGNH